MLVNEIHGRLSGDPRPPRSLVLSWRTKTGGDKRRQCASRYKFLWRIRLGLTRWLESEPNWHHSPPTSAERTHACVSCFRCRVPPNFRVLPALLGVARSLLQGVADAALLPCTRLSLSADGFVDVDKAAQQIDAFFKPAAASPQTRQGHGMGSLAEGGVGGGIDSTAAAASVAAVAGVVGGGAAMASDAYADDGSRRRAAAQPGAAGFQASAAAGDW